MLRKTVVLGSLLTAVCVSPSSAHSSFFKSGFSAGAHVGIANGYGTFNTNFAPNNVLVAPLGSSVSASGKARKTSALFGVVGGYRQIFNEGYTVGFDVTVDVFSNNELSKQLAYTFPGFAPANFTAKLKRRFSVIPSLNFGKVFCNRWHVGVGLGLGISGFQSRVSSATFGTNVSASKTKVGFVPSINVEYAATQNVSIVGKLGYEIYSKISKSFNNGQATGILPTSSYTTSISPRYVTLSLGATYRF